MSCTIYLVRHGIAEAGVGKDDAERELTDDGRRKMRHAAAGLLRLGVAPEVVLSSPLLRARQTAEILAAGLGGKLQTGTCAALAPGHSPLEVVEGLRAYRDAGSLMLVGHEPGIGMLGSQLLAGRAEALALAFKKGAVAAIEVAALAPGAEGALLWFLTPKQLRLVADGAV